MHFKSRKDTFFKVVFAAAILLCCVIVTIGISSQQNVGNDIWGFAVVILVIGLLLWMFFGTNYTITATHLSYKCGPFRGKIALAEIQKIETETTMWAGYRLATARKGIIVYYNKYKRIYISPDTNEFFISELRKNLPAINVVNKG